MLHIKCDLWYKEILITGSRFQSLLPKAFTARMGVKDIIYTFESFDRNSNIYILYTINLMYTNR